MTVKDLEDTEGCNIGVEGDMLMTLTWMMKAYLMGLQLQMKYLIPCCIGATLKTSQHFYLKKASSQSWRVCAHLDIIFFLMPFHRMLTRGAMEPFYDRIEVMSVGSVVSKFGYSLSTSSFNFLISSWNWLSAFMAPLVVVVSSSPLSDF